MRAALLLGTSLSFAPSSKRWGYVAVSSIPSHLFVCATIDWDAMGTAAAVIMSGLSFRRHTCLLLAGRASDGSTWVIGSYAHVFSEVFIRMTATLSGKVQ